MPLPMLNIKHSQRPVRFGSGSLVESVRDTEKTHGSIGKIHPG
jgi:hypothetical protein